MKLKYIFSATVILPLFVMLSCIGGLPHWCSSLFFVAYCLYLIIMVRRLVSINKLELLFLIYLALCTLLSSPDSVFHSWERLVIFSILILFSTSVLESEYNRKLRRKSLKMVLCISISISIMSFFCYFLNINLFEDSYSGEFFSDYNDFIGHFSGIAKHSMVLGPLAGISTIYLFIKYLDTKSKKCLMIMVLCIGSLFFAASRGAIFATLFGISIYFLKYIRNGNKKSIVLAFIIGILLFPIYQPYIDAALNKHGNKGNFGVYDSRTQKVDARIYEFTESPIYGVGFCAIDPNGKDEYNVLTGSIEPGSSWLAVLSMSGLFGFLFFLVIIGKAMYQANKRKDNLLISILAFFSIHMLVEGYVFSAGNALSFLFWLSIGCCLDLRYEKCNKNIQLEC